MLQPYDRDPQKRDSQKKDSPNQGPQIVFAWESESPEDKFLHVEEMHGDLTVTVHPGLSYHQVCRAAEDLGEHGPIVVQAWVRHTGYIA